MHLWAEKSRKDASKTIWYKLLQLLRAYTYEHGAEVLCILFLSGGGTWFRSWRMSRWRPDRHSPSGRNTLTALTDALFTCNNWGISGRMCGDAHLQTTRRPWLRWVTMTMKLINQRKYFSIAVPIFSHRLHRTVFPPTLWQQLQGSAENLQSKVGDVVAASKALTERLGPLAANLIQSETRVLSRDVLLLVEVTSGRVKSLQVRKFFKILFFLAQSGENVARWMSTSSSSVCRRIWSSRRSFVLDWRPLRSRAWTFRINSRSAWLSRTLWRSVGITSHFFLDPKNQLWKIKAAFNVPFCQTKPNWGDACLKALMSLILPDVFSGALGARCSVCVTGRSQRDEWLREAWQRRRRETPHAQQAVGWEHDSHVW